MTLLDRLRRYRQDPDELPKGALGQLTSIVKQQMIVMLGSRVLDWVMEKPGRRFVFENDTEEGIAFYFEENGEKVTPGFMEKVGG